MCLSSCTSDKGLVVVLSAWGSEAFATFLCDIQSKDQGCREGRTFVLLTKRRLCKCQATAEHPACQELKKRLQQSLIACMLPGHNSSCVVCCEERRQLH
jgi:hypothetical protein